MSEDKSADLESYILVEVGYGAASIYSFGLCSKDTPKIFFITYLISSHPVNKVASYPRCAFPIFFK